MKLMYGNSPGRLVERVIHKMAHKRLENDKIEIMYGDKKVLRKHQKESLRDKQF